MHGRKRLHISPLNSDLLPLILPADLFQRASNISFHTIQTSQERNYGYVDLPEMDAEKLRKKLNGSILKGSKMRVENARPEKARNEILPGDGPHEDTHRQRRKKAEKVDGVIPGIELPEGRKVKRGWTEPAAASKKGKLSKNTKTRQDKKLKPRPSSFTNEHECLFRTKLPPNAVASDTKAIKRKRGVSGSGVVVHEFEHTTKHATFLRDSSGAMSSEGAVEYVEGKGWTGRNGEILEEGPEMRRTRPNLNKGTDVMSTKYKQDSPLATHEVSKIPSIRVYESAKADEATDFDDETSSSGTSSSSAGDSDGESSTTSAQKNGTDTDLKKSASPLPSEEETSEDNVPERVRAMSVSNNLSAEPQANQDLSKSQPIIVHPLEALFKRPKIAASSTPRKPALEVSTSFNFFDHDADEESSNVNLVPHTPFTQQDFRERRQRSAAPTPDTAAPGKSFGNVWVARSESGEEDKEEKEAQNVREAVQSKTGTKEHGEAQSIESEEKPESDFSKWFWEHRGETNRAWKRRRREVSKEKRQKDNKKT